MLHAGNEKYTKHICENKEEIQKQKKYINLYNIRKIELHVDDSIKLSNEIKEASKGCGCSSKNKVLSRYTQPPPTCTPVE